MKKEWVYYFGNQLKDSNLRYHGWVAIDVRSFGLGLCTYNRNGSHWFEFSLAFLTIYVGWWEK